MVKRETLVTLIAISGVLAGCAGSQIQNFTPQDSRLTSALTTASSGRGVGFFMMPNSNDYANIPQDPLNPITDAKVKLGKLLYHETGLGQAGRQVEGDKTYSCASCHHTKAGFQACLPQAIGEGGSGFGINGEGRVTDTAYLTANIDTQPIRTPSAMNIAYQTNILWNGQFGATGVNVGTNAQWTVGTPKEKNNLGFEGTETQAIAGQGVHRLLVNQTVVDDLGYTALFDAAFPNDPVGSRYTDVNAGLAIAAYERTLLSNNAPFQRWLRGEYTAMTPAQKSGAELFFGKADCVSCHTGPALNKMDFYAVGMNDLYQRSDVINANAGSPENLGRGGFTGVAGDNYKFKVPQLYNLKDSPFYGHGASFTSVRDVVEYFNTGVAENGVVPGAQLASEFVPLGLTPTEIDQITDFIENALYDPTLGRYAPRSIKSGLAFPNNDPQSRIDLGF